jgi:hypothetical protein
MKYSSRALVFCGVLVSSLAEGVAQCQTLAPSFRHSSLPLFLRPTMQATQSPTPVPGQTAKPAKLTINVIGGAGAVNDVKQRTPRDITIEIDDEKDQPVTGAMVTFFSPNEGPGGSFVGDSHLLTVMTGSDGRAVAKDFRPNDIPGDYKIQVNAAFGDQVATAEVSQSNQAIAEPPVTKRSGMSSKKMGIIIAAGAAVAIGAAVGLAHGGSSSSNSSGQTATIGVGGTPTVGAPH